MKKIGCTVLALLLLLTGCGRGSYRTVMSVAQQNSHSFSMRYELFDGEKVYTIKAGDQKVAVAVSVETQSGNLAITIAKDGEEPVYSGHHLLTTDFVVYLNEPGKYTVTLSAQDHSGSYYFDWSE